MLCYRSYSNNIILKTFVYPFFESKTITPKIPYFLIPQIFSFLQACCQMTISVLSGETRPFWMGILDDTLEERIKKLEFELTWLAKSFMIRAVLGRRTVG